MFVVDEKLKVEVRNCGYLSATAGAQKDLDYHLAQIFYITRKQQQNCRL